MYLLYMRVWPENKGAKSNPVPAVEVIGNIPDDLGAFGSELTSGLSIHVHKETLGLADSSKIQPENTPSAEIGASVLTASTYWSDGTATNYLFM